MEEEGEAATFSLDSRIEQRARELEAQQTERFAIPGYEGVVEVELRALGYKSISAIQHHNARIRIEADRELYNMADVLLRATVGFFDVTGNNGGRAIPDDWVALAKRRQDCPDAPTPRQALLFFVGEQRIHFLAEDYTVWAKEARTDIDDEVQADFARTGSPT